MTGLDSLHREMTVSSQLSDPPEVGASVEGCRKA